MATIEHMGRVVSVGSGYAQVEVERSGACVSCQAKSVCGSSEREAQLVTAILPPSRQIVVGDVVKVAGREGLGFKAVVLAYVLPMLLVLLILILGSVVFGWTDGISGLAALCVTLPYGLLLWLCRKRLSRTFTFRIEK